MRAPVNWELHKWISFSVLQKSGRMSHSPLFIPEVEIKRNIHAQAPSSLTKWNEFRGSPSLWDHVIDKDNQKQNPKHNRAELGATRKWIISHIIPSLDKAVKPICGVVNDCRTLTSMNALIVPHFRHYWSEKTAGYHNHESLGLYGVSKLVMCIV